MENPLSAFFARHPSVRHHDVAKRADIPLDTFRAYVSDRRFPVRRSTQDALEAATKAIDERDFIPSLSWTDYEPHFRTKRARPGVAPADESVAEEPVEEQAS